MSFLGQLVNLQAFGSLLLSGDSVRSFHDRLRSLFTGCCRAPGVPVLGRGNLVNMPARKFDSVLVGQRNNHPDFYGQDATATETSNCQPEQVNDIFSLHNRSPQAAVTKSAYIPFKNHLSEPYYHPPDKGPYVAQERSAFVVDGLSRADRTSSGLSQVSSDGNFSSQEKSFGASGRHKADRVTTPVSDQNPSVIGYTNLDKKIVPILRKASSDTPAHNLAKFGRYPERSVSIESSGSSRRNGVSDQTGVLLRRRSSGAFSDGFSSSDGATPNVSSSKLNLPGSNSRHGTSYTLEATCEEGDEVWIEPQEPASWARQTEHSYCLQGALARRLMAEAELTSETRLIGKHFEDISCSAARRSVDATAHRFWVNGSLGYKDIIQDGFYHIWGMNPRVWTMCNHPAEANKMPSLESLRVMNPADSHIEVVLVDKNGDSHLRALVRDLEFKVDSLRADCGSNPYQIAEMLGAHVCMLLGGPGATEQGDLLWRWKQRSRALQDCLSSVVLPLGSLSVGLCRHRALLFKTLADCLNLPCRIARGCKYCASEDGASCMVLCEAEREYNVDLIGRPGHLSSPDSVWTNSSWSFWSPLRFPDFKRRFSGEDRSWSRTYRTDAGSSDGMSSGGSRSLDDGVEKGPRHWFPSGSAELTFADDAPGAEVWAIMKVSEDRAYHVFKDQLQNRRRDGKEPEKIFSSGNLSFVARVNSSRKPVKSDGLPSVHALTFQEENYAEQHTGAQVDSAVCQTGMDQGNAAMGRVETSSAERRPQRLSTFEDFEIVWKDIVMKERVGAGSFGTVYRADWLGSDVAVKILMEQDVRGDQLTEFFREVAIMKRLRHPNVVLFMGAVTVPPNLSIVTEYLSRGSLFKLMHKGVNRDMLDERRRVKMAYDVAKGMNYLHRSNPPIVHRDLKSPNLLVDKTFTVKVADFGLSRFKGNAFLSSRTAAGTPEWMAPEVLRDEPANEKSDVYSFGVVLWELITLQLPWKGLSPAQVIGAVGFQNRRLSVPRDLHRDMATILEACWSNDPQDRPSFTRIMQQLKDFQTISSGQHFKGLFPNDSEGD